MLIFNNRKKMKNISKITNMKYCIAVLLVISLWSCTKDLNISPKDDDTFTDEQFYADPASYKQFLAKIYAGLAVTGQAGPAGDSDFGNGSGIDEGFSQYLRGYWQLQELTTDEAIISWGESDNPTIKYLNFNTWDADNKFVYPFFARVFYQIGLCNEYLRQTTDAKLDSRGVDSSLRAQIKTFRAEVRFLRALSYYHAVDIFGKMPFATEDDILGTAPAMQSRSYVFDYILGELDAIDADLFTPKTNEYGRVDKAAAWMLKAKLLLNAKVYTGVDRSADALVAVNKVITSGYGIAQIPYANLFKADNDTNGAQNEAIFPILFDGNKTKTYGGTTFLIHAGSNNAVASSLGFPNGIGWSGYRARKEFVQSVGTTDSRVMYVAGNTDPASITDYTDYSQGKKLIKFSNKRSDGTNGQDASTFADADFPLFRMADAYLMYAELAVVNGQGDLGTALTYVNALRTRANVAPAFASDLTPAFILNERAKELYWEGHRRQDLIRFNKYTSGYTWEWKGGNQSGSDIAEYRTLFPIPNIELNSNDKLSQNPGY
jgi:hypothetical protein